MAKTLSRFYIRKQDEHKDMATLFFRVQNKEHKIDSIFSSQIQVDVQEWRNAISSEENWMRHREKNFKLHDTLAKIEMAVKSEVEGMHFDKKAVKEAILAVANPKKSDAVKKARKAEEDTRLKQEREKVAEEERQRKKAELERANIWNFLDRFVNDIKAGKRLNGNDPYTPGSCKAWSSFRKLYNGFDPRHKLTWDDVDRELVTKFLAHLAKLDYMGSSINKYLVSFRAMVGYAYADGLHNNDRSMACFSKRKVEESDKAVEIYLTEAELQALADMELTGLKDQVRDIFLIGCYTCQRVSDYNNIQPEDFTTTAKGTPIIRLIQQKTRNEVKIPIMNPNLKAICEKYNYNIPSVIDVMINRYIKEILEDLSATVPSLAVKVPTKLTMKQKNNEASGKLTVERNAKGEVVMPRYNCVTTHTARRSGITNMYLSHKYTIVQMMHVSGHKTQKTFMDYIKLSSDEIADEIDAIANPTQNDVF